MPVDIDELRERVDDLAGQMVELRVRLQRLESSGSGAHAIGDGLPPSPGGSGPEGPSAPAIPGALDAGSVALLGRALLIVGGAYFLRALSERGLVSPLAAATVALLYAMGWILVCDRSAAKGRRLAALFHGVTGMGIGVSLVWETTVRMSLIGVGTASAVSCGVFALAFGIAIRRDLELLAWLALAAHIVVAFAIAFGAGRGWLPMTGALLVSALAVEGGARESWSAMRWPAALGLDAGAAILVGAALSRASAAETALPQAPVIALLLAIPAVYLGSEGVRSLGRARPVTGFDVIQAAASLLVGLGGAALVAKRVGASALPLGVPPLLVGIGLYVSGLSSVARVLGRSTTFYVHGAFAGLLVWTGLALTLSSRAALAVACALLALGISLVGRRLDRLDLLFHGAGFGIAGVLLSGLAGAVTGGTNAPPWEPVTAMDLSVVVACAGAALALLASRPPGSHEAIVRIPRIGLAAAALVAVLGVVVRRLGPWVFSLGVEATGRALIAGMRSVLLALTAIGVASIARSRGLPELRWLAVGVLVAGAAQLVFEALRLAGPTVLFVSLAAYGGALITTSRLLRSRRDRDIAPAAGAASKAMSTDG